MKTLLKNCDIVATGKEGFEVIRNGFCGIDGEVIDYLGAVEPKARYDIIKDMSGKTLYPGLVNAHCHSAMTLLRGLGSDLPLHEWLYDYMFPTEDRLRAEDVRAGSELAMLEMLSTGTVSFSDMYYFSEETAEAVMASGMKANICRTIQAFDPSEPYENNYRVKQSMAFYKAYANASAKVRAELSIHGEYTCNDKVARRYCEDCLDLGARLHIHLSETAAEQSECIARHGKTPARWFHDLGAFKNPTLAAHCVWVTQDDLELLHNSGVAVAHNPTSNMKLGSGFAPVPRMLELGIVTGIGTDGAASNNNLNMIEEMHLASVMHNGFLHDPVVMNPADILKMATQNGALLQGRPDCGAIAVGKKADIMAVSFDGPHMLPALDPIAMLCYSAQGSDVCMTMVDGKVLYENGEFLTLDRDRIYAKARASVKHIYNC